MPDPWDELRREYFRLYDVPKKAQERLSKVAIRPGSPGYHPTRPKMGEGYVTLPDEWVSPKRTLEMAHELGGHGSDKFMFSEQGREAYPDIFRRDSEAAMPSRPAREVPKAVLEARRLMNKMTAAGKYSEGEYPQEVFARSYEGSRGRMPPWYGDMYSGLLSENEYGLPTTEKGGRWGSGLALSQAVASPEWRKFIAEGTAKRD